MTTSPPTLLKNPKPPRRDPCALSDLRASLGRRQRLLGFDVGTKTIGYALSDITLTVASPLETWHRKKWKEDIAHLEQLIRTHDIGGFLLGLPLNMDGSDSPRTQGVRAFAYNLMAAFPLPLAFWDERWSTAAVERTLIEADQSRARRAEVIDKLAATYILQGALHGL